MIVNIPDLTPKECAEIAICAAEGGINYWAVVDEYDWSSWDPYAEPEMEIPEDTVFYTIVGDTDGTPAEEFDIDFHGPYRVTVKSIREGYQMVLNGLVRRDLYNQALDCILSREPGAVDADVADCIIQLGVLGEIVYG